MTRPRNAIEKTFLVPLVNPFATMCAFFGQIGGSGGRAPWRVARGGTPDQVNENEREGLWLSNGGKMSSIGPVLFEKK